MSSPTSVWATASSDPPQAPSTAPAPGGNELDDVLLTARLVGSGFTVSDPADPQPLPCTPDQPPVDEQVPNVEKGVADFVADDDSVEVSEQIYVYGSETEAVRHQQIDEAGLACGHGTMGSASIDISSPADVAGQLDEPRIDVARAWSVSNQDIDGELIVVRLHAVLVQFAFVADAKTAPSVDVQAVINAGVARIVSRA